MRHQKVIFVHIPKTAGTSLYQNLYHQYPILSFFHYLDYKHGDLTQVEDGFRVVDFRHLPKWVRQRTMVHGGHMPYGFHQGVNDNFKYVTFLRNPVDRIISNYHHIRFRQNHPSNRIIRQEDISLIDFVNDTRFQDGQNFMTRILSGTFKQIKVDQNLYDCALNNILEKGFFIGFQEEFNVSLALLSDMLGWKKPLIFAHVNRAVHQQGYDDNVLEMVRAKNMWDIKLYDTLRDEFNKKHKSRGEQLIKEMEHTSLSGQIRLQNFFKRQLIQLCNRVMI